MKIFTKFSGFLFLFVILTILIQHSLCPVYDYPPERIFSGTKVYNPYSNVRNQKIIKANFHAHSRIWLGLTNGRDNYKEELVKRYKFLNYDIAGISDYQSINDFQRNDPLYIPEYEHGFGFTKNHQLSLETNSVLWNDFILVQTTDNKQNIIKELKRRSDLVVLAHPLLRDAYDEEDMKKLTDYDCMEIINRNYGQAFKLWDAALSSGHFVMAMGDDDSHESSNPHDMGCCFNLIYCDTITKFEVIKSLKSGSNIVAYQDAENMLLKREKALAIPRLLYCDIINDSIILILNKVPNEIDFIGQNGNILKKEYSRPNAVYQMKPEDTYVRSDITFSDGTVFYLNPIVKYNGEKPPNLSSTVNTSKTFILRLTSSIILIFVVSVFVYIKRRTRKQ